MKKEIKTSQKIIAYLQKRGQASGQELANYLGITARAVRKQTANLLGRGEVRKTGKPPIVFYLLNERVEKQRVKIFDPQTKRVINRHFLLITPSGQRKKGVEGFIEWCQKRKLEVGKTAKEYLEILSKYGAYKKDGLIDGRYKLKHTFSKVYLDKVFYLDFYSIERFGKTKLGQMLLYAKQSQDKNLIKDLSLSVADNIRSLVKKYGVEAVGFIPPTVKREVQFMKVLKKNLNLPLPVISLVKVKTEVVVPQKTLNKLGDRIENAEKTIFVDENRKYGTVLLIDDALGSGATMNETAKKIKLKGVAGKVIALAITGSFSGFEVISEV